MATAVDAPLKSITFEWEREQEVIAAVSGRRHAFDSDLTHNAQFVILIPLGVSGETYTSLLSGDYGMTPLCGFRFLVCPSLRKPPWLKVTSQSRTLPI